MYAGMEKHAFAVEQPYQLYKIGHWVGGVRKVLRRGRTSKGDAEDLSCPRICRTPAGIADRADIQIGPFGSA
jgi:hypothetical protein